MALAKPFGPGDQAVLAEAHTGHPAATWRRRLGPASRVDGVLLVPACGASTSTDRVAGYRAALSEACPAGDCGQILFGEFTEASGYAMTRQILDSEPRPTAIFAANNFIAFGALKALREAGLGVPDDLSIVVFDDLPPGWMMDPFLTVVSQPAYEIGTQAATLLFERLAGEAPVGSRSVVLPSELVIRRSTAPPRAARRPTNVTHRPSTTEQMEIGR